MDLCYPPPPRPSVAATSSRLECTSEGFSMCPDSHADTLGNTRRTASISRTLASQRAERAPENACLSRGARGDRCWRSLRWPGSRCRVWETEGRTEEETIPPEKWTPECRRESHSCGRNRDRSDSCCLDLETVEE